jgi:transcriptional regulator with XRE-family HTH domain
MGHLQKIRPLVKRSGLSLARVEQAAGLSQGRLTKAKGGILRPDELDRVAAVLRVPVESFDDPPPVADPERAYLDTLIGRYGTESCVAWILEGARREAAPSGVPTTPLPARPPGSPPIVLEQRAPVMPPPRRRKSS